VENSAAFNAGQVFGSLVVLVIILAIGVYFGNRLARKRDDGLFVRWPVGVALAVDLVAILGQCSTPGHAQTASANTSTGDIVVEKKVVGSKSDVPNSIDADYVKKYNDGVRHGAVNGLHNRGVSFDEEALTASTEVVSFSGHKVLKSKVIAPSRVFLYQFVGVASGDIVAVVCSSRTAQAFVTQGTDCERQARLTFGD